MSIKLEVWGAYALFTRPEMKVERVSYDVMTPSAARGLIEAITGTRECAGASTASMSAPPSASPICGAMRSNPPSLPALSTP